MSASASNPFDKLSQASAEGGQEGAVGDDGEGEEEEQAQLVSVKFTKFAGGTPGVGVRALQAGALEEEEEEEEEEGGGGRWEEEEKGEEARATSPLAYSDEDVKSFRAVLHLSATTPLSPTTPLSAATPLHLAPVPAGSAVIGRRSTEHISFSPARTRASRASGTRVRHTFSTGHRDEDEERILYAEDDALSPARAHAHSPARVSAHSVEEGQDEGDGDANGGLDILAQIPRISPRTRQVSGSEPRPQTSGSLVAGRGLGGLGGGGEGGSGSGTEGQGGRGRVGSRSVDGAGGGPDVEGWYGNAGDGGMGRGAGRGGEIRGSLVTVSSDSCVTNMSTPRIASFEGEEEGDPFSLGLEGVVAAMKLARGGGGDVRAGSCREETGMFGGLGAEVTGGAGGRRTLRTVSHSLDEGRALGKGRVVEEVEYIYIYICRDNVQIQYWACIIMCACIIACICNNV